MTKAEIQLCMAVKNIRKPSFDTLYFAKDLAQTIGWLKGAPGAPV